MSTLTLQNQFRGSYDFSLAMLYNPRRPDVLDTGVLTSGVVKRRSRSALPPLTRAGYRLRSGGRQSLRTNVTFMFTRYSVIFPRSIFTFCSWTADYFVSIEFDDVEGLAEYLRHPAHEELGVRFTESLAGALVYDSRRWG